MYILKQFSHQLDVDLALCLFNETNILRVNYVRKQVSEGRYMGKLAKAMVNQVCEI